MIPMAGREKRAEWGRKGRRTQQENRQRQARELAPEVEELRAWLLLRKATWRLVAALGRVSEFAVRNVAHRRTMPTRGTLAGIKTARQKVEEALRIQAERQW
jgi:hypothetical protein